MLEFNKENNAYWYNKDTKCSYLLESFISSYTAEYDANLDSYFSREEELISMYQDTKSYYNQQKDLKLSNKAKITGWYNYLKRIVNGANNIDINFIAEVNNIRHELNSSDKNEITADLYAKKLLDIMDNYYNTMKLPSGSSTGNNFISMLGGNAMRISNSELEPYRAVLGMKNISDMPYTYQYFNTHLSHKYSQYDQDGIIEAIYNLIGTKNKFFVEIGGGSVIDNSMLLRTEKEWTGILFNSGNYFVDKITEEMLRNEWITPDNINDMFEKHQVITDLDLLSIDVDSNDYWLWKSLDIKFQPAVVIVEHNPNFHHTMSYAVQNNEPYLVWDDTKYYGASIKAFYDLAHDKGYEYVYHMAFTDIFFVRSDLLPDTMKGMHIEDTFDVYPIHFIRDDMENFQEINTFGMEETISNF
jgi:hypothetical protein